ncbi:MAG: septum formation protein Maf [Bacteroidaceae bacterium]|nr:septum formation protein Maf [Bacteroidales bacterium]MBP3671635.1 septum formation protein Maf [Bacteroidaceae bacterium]MBQ2978969.1 septum formation protein Maf [Bacteroidaceae bacterium]
MLENLSHYDILLASNSPRRRELLAGLGIQYQVVSLPEIDETYPPSLQGSEIPQFISRQKADAYKSMMTPRTLLITADTIVWLNGKVYGKPTDDNDARKMLRELSGNTHIVITGVTITTTNFQRVFAVESEVTFDNLSDEEIDYYVENYKPLDKAGAYGIQEWIGYIGVTGLKGSYFNVMGLPIQRLYNELKQIKPIML